MTEILDLNISINDSQNWEEFLYKKLKEFDSCKVSVNKIQLISRFYGEKIRKFDKRQQFQKQEKSLRTNWFTFFLCSTTRPITLSLTGFELIIVPLSAGVSCGVAVGTKLASEFLT